MTIDGGRARVRPNFGRVVQPADGFAEEARRARPGFFNFAPIGFVVAAVDVATGEIQDKVGVLEFFGPVIRSRSVSPNNPPRRGACSSGYNDNVVAVGLKVPSKNCSHLAGTTRQHNAKWTRVHARIMSVIAALSRQKRLAGSTSTITAVSGISFLAQKSRAPLRAWERAERCGDFSRNWKRYS